MSDYANILVAVDFSSSADQILTKAEEIAQRSNGRLNLLHVVEYMPPIDTGFDPLLTDSLMINEDALVENARKSLEKIIDQKKLNHTSLEVALGTPKHEITKYVAEHQCDLVVIGSHGRHGIKMLLGSTANAVLHAMPCDVLTVKLK